MAKLLPYPQAILFTIPVDGVNQYRAWKLEADHAFLRAQLEKYGRAMVLRLRGEEYFDEITELPALGEAEPQYGTFGGGYPFVFRPHRTGCSLVVTSPAPVEPIQLDLPAPQLLFETIPTPANDGILDEQPTDEGAVWRFGISQQSFERLVKWGWDSAILGAYSYTFIPTNVGCVVYVTNEASEERIWLVDPDDL